MQSSQTWVKLFQELLTSVLILNHDVSIVIARSSSGENIKWLSDGDREAYYVKNDSS